LDAVAGRFVPESIPARRLDIVETMKNRTLPLAFAAVLALAAAAPAAAQKAVFVVRHAEKISEQDQRLSDAGRARAARLASMLADSGISAIYATDTERARDTAAPLAQKLGQKVATYDTGQKMSGAVDARPFVAMLRREHARDVVLVVGHSNTIPDLLKALGCSEKITLGADEYDDLFVVVPKADGTATLVRLRY
jgi:phosphohistidine phosphatase SixA